MLKYIVLLMVLAGFGCTTITVQPVPSGLDITHVCIEDGQLMCFDGDMMGIIRDGFERHNISSEIYMGTRPPTCKYWLSYMCNRMWDMALFMHHAELRLYHDMSVIGYAEYHLVGQGGFAPIKWESTKKKMDPVIDRLLNSYPIMKPGL